MGVALVIVQIAMEDLAQHLSTSVRERPKPSVIRLLALFHLNTVKKENKEANRNKLKSMFTPSNADQFPRRCATMLIKCHWYPVVFLLHGRNVASILKSVARMYPSNIAIKYHIR